MKKLALVSFSLVSLVGVALAQQGAPPAKAPAPAADKKAPPPAGAPAQVMPVKPTEPPKPPMPAQELVDIGKQMNGTWKCTGQSNMGGNMIDIKATVTHRVDANLNKLWLQSTFVGTAAKLPPLKMTFYTTWDATAKKLWRVNVGSRGGHGTGWGTISDKKISWEGEGRWPDGTDVKTRTTEEFVSAKEVKLMGEASKDGGKTWSKEVEATCKK